MRDSPAQGAPAGGQVADLQVIHVAADEMARQAPPASASPQTPDTRPPLEIAGVSVDLAKLLGRRHSLFPFLTIETSLVDPGDSRKADRSAHLRTPFALRSGASSLPPLLLSDDALQALVDRAWSRRERWRPFAPIAVLVESHDPDQGRSADLLQAYRDQNLLQPYYDSDTRDARFWAMLGLAADHVTFIELVRRVARTHRSSRVTTELLFLLDELVQGSRDTLLMLTSTDPQAALRRTAAEQPEAYAFAVALREHYGEWLQARKLESADAIRARYDRVRLQLLSAILERTPDGYRASDACYLAGVIAFEQNNLAGAERWWRQMRPARSDSYAAAAAEVLAALQLPEDRRAAEIVRVLGTEHRRWLDFSEQRLRQFGHAADKF